jgi:hypothetical protein
VGLDLDPSASKVQKTRKCVFCNSDSETSLLMFQGTDSDYYFCSVCKQWYEVFLESSLTLRIEDKRRIKALEYCYDAQFQWLYATSGLRNLLVRLRNLLEDAYIWMYRRSYE